MFNNIGKKIKGLVKIICYVGIAISVIIAIICFVGADGNRSNPPLQELYMILGFVFLLVAPLCLWAGSFFMYAFGQLVEDTHYIKMKLYNEELTKIPPSDQCEEKPLPEMTPDGVVAEDVPDGEWVCPECCRTNKNTNICKCGYKKD